MKYPTNAVIDYYSHNEMLYLIKYAYIVWRTLRIALETFFVIHFCLIYYFVV